MGGAGCNVISWVKERGLAGGKLIAVNTDATHLATSSADRKVLIGEKTCKGLGCGGYPELGERAMRENIGDVLEGISDAKRP